MKGFIPLFSTLFSEGNVVALVKEGKGWRCFYPSSLSCEASEEELAPLMHQKKWIPRDTWETLSIHKTIPVNTGAGVFVLGDERFILLLFLPTEPSMETQHGFVSLLTLMEENAALEMQNESLKLQLEAIFAFHKSIIGTFELLPLVENFMKVLTQTFGYANSALLQYDEETKELFILAAVNYPQEVEKNIRIPLGKGITGDAAEKRETIIVGDVQKDPRYLMGVPEARSEIAIPLLCQGKLLGVLDVESTKVNAFSLKDRLLLEPLANTLALLMWNTRLFSEQQKMLWQTVEALAEAIEAKDPYMRGHVARSAYYGEQLAKRLGLTQEASFSIRLACMLHDIGKIGIPEQILQKPSPLEEAEKRIVERHVEIGVQILKEIKQLQPIVPYVKAHHERWDGLGYPQGLKGEEIPLGARIVSLVDAYDAMTTHRPYRRALSPDECREELEKSKGTQFDPSLVDAFLFWMDERKPQDFR